jgi:hypothetical protein
MLSVYWKPSNGKTGENVEQLKRKSKKKLGRVIRVTPDLQAIIEVEKKKNETIPEVLRRLLGLRGEVRYVLPSDIYETPEDARGVAVMRAVKSKNKKIERPLSVRVKE